MTSCYNGLGKIELINNICKNTLTITMYLDGWEMHSYGPGTALSLKVIGEALQSRSLKGLVETALERLRLQGKEIKKLYK